MTVWGRLAKLHRLEDKVRKARLGVYSVLSAHYPDGWSYWDCMKGGLLDETDIATLQRLGYQVVVREMPLELYDGLMQSSGDDDL